MLCFLKGNKEADRAAKEAMDMPGMTTTRLPYTWSSGGREAPNGKENGKVVIAHYTTSNLTLKSKRVSTTVVGNMRLSWVGSVLDTQD